MLVLKYGNTIHSRIWSESNGYNHAIKNQISLQLEHKSQETLPVTFCSLGDRLVGGYILAAIKTSPSGFLRTKMVDWVRLKEECRFENPFTVSEWRCPFYSKLVKKLVNVIQWTPVCSVYNTRWAVSHLRKVHCDSNSINWLNQLKSLITMC